MYVTKVENNHVYFSDGTVHAFSEVKDEYRTCCVSWVDVTHVENGMVYFRDLGLVESGVKLRADKRTLAELPGCVQSHGHSGALTKFYASMKEQADELMKPVYMVHVDREGLYCFSDGERYNSTGLKTAPHRYRKAATAWCKITKFDGSIIWYWHIQADTFELEGNRSEPLADVKRRVEIVNGEYRDFWRNMLDELSRGRYIGYCDELKGKMALLKFDSLKVFAQFDNDLGWHEFGFGDFEYGGRNTAGQGSESPAN